MSNIEVLLCLEKGLIKSCHNITAWFDEVEAVTWVSGVATTPVDITERKRLRIQLISLKRQGYLSLIKTDSYGCWHLTPKAGKLLGYSPMLFPS